MYKLLKWIYDLAYNKGFDDGVAREKCKQSEEHQLERFKALLEDK